MCFITFSFIIKTVNFICTALIEVILLTKAKISINIFKFIKQKLNKEFGNN